MAKQDVMTPAERAVCGRNELLNSFLNMRSAIRLARSAVGEHMNDDYDLTAAEGVLMLAESEADRIYERLDQELNRDLYKPSLEVCHG